jgi:hypothetical protein
MYHQSQSPWQWALQPLLQVSLWVPFLHMYGPLQWKQLIAELLVLAQIWYEECGLIDSETDGLWKPEWLLSEGPEEKSHLGPQSNHDLKCG